MVFPAEIQIEVAGAGISPWSYKDSVAIASRVDAGLIVGCPDGTLIVDATATCCGMKANPTASGRKRLKSLRTVILEGLHSIKM